MSIQHFNCFNARGLGNCQKRRTIFHWLKKIHNGIIFLQETHSSTETENTWKKDWGGNIVFNHGTPQSRGVAILFPRAVEYIVKSTEVDQNGRALLLDIDIEGENMVLVNIYAPTKDKENKQIQFLSFLRTILLKYADKSILLGGDLNTYLNTMLDKKGGTNKELSRFAHGIHDLMEEYNLTDIYRIVNPDIKRFTWRGNTRKGLVQSRLDYWICSTHMLYNLQSVDIKPGIKSDHSILNITFKMQNSVQRGRGFWKFNSSLLCDTGYIKKIKQILDDCSNRYNDVEKGLRWEVIKCELRSATISYASWKTKLERKEEELLVNELSKLQNTLDLCVENLERYKIVQQKVEQIAENKSRGAFIRSRANYIENDEKCTKIFLQKEINNSKKKHVRCLITEQGTFEDPKQILDKQKEYYSRLYTQNEYNECNHDCEFFKADFPKLSDNEVQICDKKISIEELGKGLRELPNNKAPGTDGFTADFYKFFWKDIKDYIYDSFVSSLKNGILSIEQRRAILTLLPKGDKDIRYLKNWRPLSLLNTDYKILTKTLALRLQKVLPSLIHPNQTGCVKNRYIGENLRILYDIMEYSNTKSLGIIAFLDFEKAFDSVSWKFLQKTLKTFNFGKYFIHWISIIYNFPECAVINNGHSSEFFTLTRGIRQGCPISAFLFILVAEVMAINIRKDLDIKNINVNGTNIKITQYADDTVLYLNDFKSLENAFKLLEKFFICSGLKLNKEKTKQYN